MIALALMLAACAGAPPPAVGGTGPAFRIFQFPSDAIPRVDGDPADWTAVGPGYAIDLSALAADDGSGRRPDPASLRGQVRVAWVKGLNRLYFLYEAWDDHWRFDAPGLTNDIFELVVDGDRSGGPLIARFHPDLASRRAQGATAPPLSDTEAWFGFQNIHAQNYHIFTPPGHKDWAMAWGPQASWIKRLPWSNIAWRHALTPGGGGKLTMEWWITPFDRADPDGPARSVETTLVEDAVIGMAWAVIDDDGEGRRAFWNLSPHHTMYGQASELCAFRLMPIEPARAPAIAAGWAYRIVDRDRRVVAFTDQSTGAVTRRHWDFGDGSGSDEANPVHLYRSSGKFVVTLTVDGPKGSDRLTRVWDVSFGADPPK